MNLENTTVTRLSQPQLMLIRDKVYQVRTTILCDFLRGHPVHHDGQALYSTLE